MSDGKGPNGVVLIVDDVETSAAALEVACAAIPGAEVWSVRSAIDALRLLRGAAQKILAVVTDIHMPRMDGFELIREIRADPARGALPIIVVSADTDPATPGRARELGANAYFSKPCSPAAVRQTLEHLLYEQRNPV